MPHKRLADQYHALFFVAGTDYDDAFRRLSGEVAGRNSSRVGVVEIYARLNESLFENLMPAVRTLRRLFENVIRHAGI